MDIEEKNREKRNKRINRNRIIGRILIIFSVITFLILSTILIIEIINMKNVEKRDNELIEIYEENKENEEKLKEYSIRALLKIPKVNIKELIYDNNNYLYDDLEQGIVVYNIYDNLSHEKNNMSVILGHNSGLRTKKVFLQLEKLDINDEFEIEFEGKLYKYNIENRYVVDPKSDGPFEREEDKNKVYLFTCYPYPINNKRLILEGVRID